MTALQKGSVALMLLLLALALLSRLPALHATHWFLRVGFPEVGWIFLLAGLPASLILGKTSRKLALALFVLLLTLVILPWLQALHKAGELKSSWGEGALARSPLRLGERDSHRKLTEEYKPGLLWDRYLPQGEAKARLLFVHGGSWRNGSKDEFPQMFEYLAERGYEVLVPNYTLSGTAPYPAASLDISAAIEKAHDPKVALFLAGRSSGGHLALLAAYTHPKLVRGVIGFYSPVDMIWSYENPSNPRVLNSQEAIVQFLGGTPQEDRELYQKTSPIAQAGPEGPPTLLIHGLPDCLVYHRQSEMLVERLTELQVPNRLVSLPWMEHGGDITIYGPSGRLSAWAVESFMESLR